MGIALLDSGVIAAFLDADDALHAAADAAVRDIARDHMFVISVITVAEVLAGAKIGHHDEGMVRQFFTGVVSERIAVEEIVAERAAELRADHRALRLPDALILATAERHADAAVTSDTRWRTVGELGCEVRVLAEL